MSGHKKSVELGFARSTLRGLRLPDTVKRATHKSTPIC